MALLAQLLDILLHIDVHLRDVIQQYGTWTYLILFVVVFCETGLVVTPFLPGDSLLFAAGSLYAAFGPASVASLSAVLIVAAVVGDTVNYWAGHWVGPGVFHRDTGRFLKKEHLQRTHEFYERHGGKTIILARFVPIIRTFAPFVAGIGRMNYLHFFAYNVVGGVVWVLLFVGAGYFFGNIPAVRERFTLVILAIVVLSVLPMVVEIIRHRLRARGASA
ncbi:MAG: DedA family protein [Deltaproteobacteria bacterium]|nr:DedA family protein [Deltaproteobacteria bacterium]